MTYRRRLAWASYLAVSAAALGTCVFLVLEARGPASAGLILLGGLIVVGMGAAMTHTLMSPAPELEDAGHARGGWEGASLDGGGHGGGDAGF
ncbi:hypothetical protein GCM10009623_36480 [Nocardioides aestuarii]|uniref:Uncharacterized protein n=1 Tax=Nocardioides aestuarii TaxID=252231 RepID=A0ABW4TT98_9ACTN